jgi:hypothetical protein
MQSRLDQFAVRTRVVCSFGVETRDELCKVLSNESRPRSREVDDMVKICFHRHILFVSPPPTPLKGPGGQVAAPKAVSAVPESGSGRAYLPPAVGIHLELHTTRDDHSTLG